MDSGGVGEGGSGGGGFGGNTTDVSATVRELASTPSTLARLLVIADELSAAATALEASLAEPVCTKEMVAVLDVVIGVDTLTALPKELVSDEVSELVSCVCCALVVARVSLESDDGVSTTTNVTK